MTLVVDIQALIYEDAQLMQSRTKHGMDTLRELHAALCDPSGLWFAQKVLAADHRWYAFAVAPGI